MTKKNIIFFSKAPMNYVMFKQIHQAMKNDNRIAFEFTGKPEEGFTMGDLYGDFFKKGDEKISSLFFAKFKKPNLYISPDMYIACRGAKIKVHIFHGVSFKGKAYTEQIRRYDKIFIVGNYMKRNFIEKKILTENDPRMVMIGMPKTDSLVDGSLLKEEIIQKIGLSGKKPIILYAPTWRKESSLNTMGEEIFSTLKSTDVDFLVKLHDLSLNPGTNKIDWRKRLNEIEGGNMKVIYDPDIIPYLFIADLLITDASSTANEFTLLDRPIIFIDVPELIKKYSTTIDLDTWGRKIGKTVTRADDLKRAILEYLDNPSELSEIRRSAARDIFYKPGGATKRAVETLYNLL